MTSPEDDPVPDLATSPSSPTSPHPPPTPHPAQNVPFVDQANADDDDDMAPRRGRSATFREVDLDLELNTAAQARAPVQEVVTGLPSFLLVPPPPSAANGEDEETSIPPPIWQNLPPHPPNLSHLDDRLPIPPARTRMIRRAVKIEQHMPSVLFASARLQNALEVFNPEPWPVPPLPGTKLEQMLARRHGGKVEGQGEVLRGALTNCKMWRVDKTRWSGLGGLIDGVMRRLVAETEGHGGVYGYVLDAESMEVVPKESVQLTEQMLEYAAGAKVVAGKGKERQVDDSAADGVVAVAEKQADGISPMNIDQSPAHDATGTTVVLTPQPSTSAARIVEISDDASTVCSEYLDPEDDSPLTFVKILPEMTDADSGMTIDHHGLDCSPQRDDTFPSVSPTEDSLYAEGSSADANDWDGAGESNTVFTTEDGVAPANLDTSMNDVDTTTGDIDTTMHHAHSTTQDTALAPGISVTTPGESSTAIQEPTAQLSKAQKKNQARKQKGYKKPKPKKQKTEHSTDDTSTASTSAANSSAASTSAAALHNAAVDNPSHRPTLPFNLKDRRTHPKSLPTPTPERMPDTFTSSICHHATFLPHAILTLTIKSTAPSFDHPDTLRKHVIAHFEVGLDGVEAIIQGQVSIPESADWKKSVREARLGKIGSTKEGDANIRFDENLCEKQLAAGHGRGMWIFFAIRWRRTVHDVRAGLGGKWVCFGAPVEALKRRQGESEKVNLNHFVEGAEEERLVEFRRMDIKFSTGGIPCFDLMYGAEKNWNDGVWEKVKRAMATAGCVVSFLYDSDGEDTQLEGGRFWGVLEKPDVEPFFSEGQMKDIPGLLPGFRTQGDRGSGLAAPGGVADLEKGKEKAATVAEVDEEDGLGGGGRKEGEKEGVERKAKGRAANIDGLLMPPPPTPVKRTSTQDVNSMVKKALEERQKKRRAEIEMEVLCARMEKASLEQYEKGLRGGRIA